MQDPEEILSSVQLLSRIQLFVTPRTAALQASLSITNSRSLLKLMSIKSVVPSNHLILCRPPSPPAFNSTANYKAHRGIWPSESESHSVTSDTLWPHGLYSPWNSPGQNTGVSSLSHLQGIFPTQGSNQCREVLLLHCRWILYQLNHQGNLFNNTDNIILKKAGHKSTQCMLTLT